MNRWREGWHDETGSALVEIALFLPVLVLILAGTVDFGLYTERKMEVVEAANAAAQYGAIAGNQLSASGMQTAAAAASPNLSGLSTTASSFWTCSPGGNPVGNTSSCPNYGTPIQYVKVATSATFSAPMPLLLLGSSLTVNGQATYRVRWKPS